MATKLLLCASAFHLSAALWRRGRISACKGFDDDPAGHDAFEAFLRGAPGVPVWLTADTVDEDYRFETMPHATGSDRREMLERRLRQLYRSTPFYGATAQEREADKRRDDRYLFAALTNAEVLNPWLPMLAAAKSPLAGVFPLPLVTAGGLKRLGIGDPNLLLVSRHCAGLRQTFVKDQRFRVSRLTPGHGGDADETHADEIRNTRMYLDALNVTHVEDTVTIVILDQDGSLGSLGANITAGRRNLRCVRLGPQELAAKFGLDRSVMEQTEDALHLHLLGQHPPDFSLAPPSLTAGYNRLRWSKLIYGMSAVSAAACAGWVAVNLYRAMELSQERARIAAETQRQQSAYQEITRTFPPAPGGSERLRQTVDVASRITALGRLPDRAYLAVSHGLDSNPAITLLSLNWKHGRGSGGDGAAQLMQSAQIQAELSMEPGDLSGALTAVNKFVKDLGRQDSVAAVRATRLPVNLGSGATLRGNTSESRKAQPVSVQFDVELVLKPGL
jgi:hypothetical protein